MKNKGVVLQNKENIDEIDVLKAIGIFLVVVGHSFPDASLSQGIQNSFCNLIYHFIYSFHMPLFIVASGFLVSYKRDYVDKTIAIQKRIVRLLIPYFVWGALYVPFRIVLSRYSSSQFNISDIWKIFIGDNPYSGLWFLYTLFFISLIQILFVDNNKKLYLGLSISFLMLLLGKCVFIIEPIKWLFLYTFYYLLGMWIRLYYVKIKKYIALKYVVYFAIPIFLLVYAASKCIDRYCGIYSILVALCGIFTMFCIAITLQKIAILQNIGKYCMDIYILSGPILVMLRIILYRICNIPYVLYVCVAIIVAFIMPIILSKYIIRKSKVLSLFLLGISNSRE